MTRSLVLALLIALAAVSLTTLDSCGDDTSDLPECLRQLVHHDPDRIYLFISPSDYISRCTYEGQEVYFMPAQCCDVPSYLFDVDCNIICWPDGGYGGGGDGRCPEFSEVDAACEVVWKK